MKKLIISRWEYSKNYLNLVLLYFLSIIVHFLIIKLPKVHFIDVLLLSISFPKYLYEILIIEITNIIFYFYYPIFNINL